jgi:GcrA cell cycle regulator
MPRQTWTDEKLDFLERLWAEGKTAAVIAAGLGGVSRSAVLGKVFRLRSGPLQNDTGALQSGNSLLLGRRRRGRRPGTAKQIISPPLQCIAASLCEPASDSLATNRACGKSLFELTNDSCRWPFGRPGTESFYFCGVASADLEGGRPYCEAHARRAYLPARKTADKADHPPGMKSALTPRSSPTVQAIVQRSMRVAAARGMRF